MPTYLFMYVSGGAGHVGRSLTIASYIRDMDSDANIIFAGGEVGREIVEENGFGFIPLKTPEYFENNRPTSNIKKLIKIYIKNLKEYRDAMVSVNPDVVVIDTEPVFVFLSRFIGFRSVFITHEIIPLWVDEIPPVSKTIRDFILRSTEKISDFVIFPDIMGIGIEDRNLKEKYVVVGPLAYMDFQEADIVGGRRILIVPSATGEIPLELADMLKKEGYDIYIRSSRRDDVEVKYLPRTKNLLSYISSVDVVICSGYSTIMEAVAVGKPVIIYPKTEEQRIVGKLCKKNGVALYAEKPGEVLSILENLFSDDNIIKNIIKKQKKYENGSMEAARFLINISKNRGKRY